MGPPRGVNEALGNRILLRTREYVILIHDKIILCKQIHSNSEIRGKRTQT